MNVSSYIFQSPYPNQFQIGRPDPAVKQEQQQEEAVNALNNIATKPTQQNVDAYMSQAKTGASVNVAGSSADAGVSAAIDGFSSANNQIQASAAYSIE